MIAVGRQGATNQGETGGGLRDGVALLWSLRKSSGLRFFRIVWRHEIVKQRASSLRWRGKIRATGCPKADNPLHESLRENFSFGGGVSCQSWLTPTRGR